jgi:hypothetical protein
VFISDMLPAGQSAQAINQQAEAFFQQHLSVR